MGSTPAALSGFVLVRIVIVAVNSAPTPATEQRFEIGSGLAAAVEPWITSGTYSLFRGLHRSGSD